MLNAYIETNERTPNPTDTMTNANTSAWKAYYTAREDALDAQREATRLFVLAQGALDQAIESKPTRYHDASLAHVMARDLRANLEERWAAGASKGSPS